MVGLRNVGPVVVGISAYGSGRGLDWAAAEAGAQRCPLRVVHAVRPPSCAVDPYGLIPLDGSAVVTAERLLAAAVARVRALAPDVDVCGRLLGGPAIPALVNQAYDARLLVLGGGCSEPPQRLRSLFAPSVGAGVTARAGCPVAVVRRLRTDPSDGSVPRVVVGVDSESSSTAALGFAFRAAAQRGLSVTAVHAWTPDVPADLEAVAGSAAFTEARAHAALERALEPWHARYAGVRVQRRVCPGEPVITLVEETRGAALVVVGARERGGGAVRTRLLGSVSCRVAQRAHSPVVVVRAQAVPRSPSRGARWVAHVPSEDEPQRGRGRGRRTAWR